MKGRPVHLDRAGVSEAAAAQTLEQLLAGRADLWRGRADGPTASPGLATGFPALDQRLPWHGWPSAGLIEVLSDYPGAALALILPGLAQCCRAPASVNHEVGLKPAESSQAQSGGHGWLLFVDPPFIPYPPALAMAGIDLERVLQVGGPSQATGRSDWVMEQALRLGGCTAIVGWVPNAWGPPSEDGHRVLPRRSHGSVAAFATAGLRRLQLAAAETGTPTFLLRRARDAERSSPALLRLLVEPCVNGLSVVLHKLRGGRAGERLKLLAPALPL